VRVAATVDGHQMGRDRLMCQAPQCDDATEGDAEWHRSCYVVALGAAVLASTPSNYRYHPKE
jgi:hypothetical protein